MLFRTFFFCVCLCFFCCLFLFLAAAANYQLSNDYLPAIKEKTNINAVNIEQQKTTVNIEQQKNYC